MNDKKPFPSHQEGRFYLSEGGTETELMYKYGFDLPEFAMYPLLNNPDAVLKLKKELLKWEKDMNVKKYSGVIFK